MPSTDHEAPLLLFRECPALVPLLLREAAGVEVPSYTDLRVGESDFTQLVPTAYRADMVVTLEQAGSPVLAVVVELQRHTDEAKQFSWPLYAAALHARVRCTTWLVVFTDDPAVARWAAEPIRTLQPSSPFLPLVVGPERVPRVTSIEDARRMPELAVLSARAHASEPDGLDVVLAALGAAASLDAERGKLYWDLVYGVMGDAMRRAVEAEMQTRGYEYQSEFARNYVAQGRAEGREEGRTEGLRTALLALVKARLGEVPADAQGRIAAIEDPGVLERSVADLAAAIDPEAMRALLAKLA